MHYLYFLVPIRLADVPHCKSPIKIVYLLTGNAMRPVSMNWNFKTISQINNLSKSLHRKYRNLSNKGITLQYFKSVRYVVMIDELEKYVIFLQAIITLWFNCYELFLWKLFLKWKLQIFNWSSSIVFQVNHIVSKMWTDFFSFTFEFLFGKGGRANDLKRPMGFSALGKNDERNFLKGCFMN